MRARLFLLLILLLVTTSFFWGDEEKSVRQLQQAGETAMQKREFEAAKKAFEELLGRIGVHSSHKHRVDWSTYVDIAMRLATAYEELHETEAADRVLALVLTQNPPDDWAAQVKLMKCRLTAKHASPAAAYYEMDKLAQQLPIDYWPAKEQSFYHALEQSLNIYYDESLRKAKLHLHAGLYAEAAVLYEEIYAAIEKKCYPKIKHKDTLLAKAVRYRLAECYFLQAQYGKSLSYLDRISHTFSDAPPSGTAIDKEMIYLSALCYREQKEYEKAVELFQRYTYLGDPDEQGRYDNALFEIGHYYFQKGQADKAKRFLERLQPFSSQPGQVAALLLARLHLGEKKPEEALKILDPLTATWKSPNPLLYEADYLRGLAAYELEKYEAARHFFENSLQQPQNEKWLAHSLYHLGWCHVHLADDPLKTEQECRHDFQRAEEIFKRLLGTEQEEEAALSLAQMHVHAFRHFKQLGDLDQLETLLLSKTKNFSPKGQLEALLLRAEGKLTYAEKEKLYEQATAEKFRHNLLYAQAWYCRGLNHFAAALENPAYPTHLFEAARSAFEKAFSWSEKGEGFLSADILKMEAKVSLCLHSLGPSLELLEQLLAQFEEKIEEREDTLFLRGLLAAYLPSHFQIAEASFNQIISSAGKYREDALYALATLYYRNHAFAQAQTTFCKLAAELPQSSRADGAWFWAAEAAAKGGDNPFPLRRHVYEDYPQSPLAAEAYFRQYPYSRYVEGHPESLHHLKEFKALFPDSPLEIIVFYLLGTHEERLENAAAAFEQSLAAFSRYPTPEKIYFHFRYRAMLELADRYFDAPDLEACEKVLLSLIDEFEENRSAAPVYPPPFEEGEFKLVQCYLKGGKERGAQDRLQKMLYHYHQAGIREGYYLSQVWLEQGRLAMRCNDYTTALHCFDIALSSYVTEKAEETHLILWLLQSECFREKKEYGTAMRLLSKVINAETASPLRLKAMYLRSEIYELEGRPELAIRQLEATAKKGGEWGQQAKDKLREYGME